MPDQKNRDRGIGFVDAQLLAQRVMVVTVELHGRGGHDLHAVAQCLCRDEHVLAGEASIEAGVGRSGSLVHVDDSTNSIADNSGEYIL